MLLYTQLSSFINAAGRCNATRDMSSSHAFLPELLRDYITKMLEATSGMKTLILDKETVRYDTHMYLPLVCVEYEPLVVVCACMYSRRINHHDGAHHFSVPVSIYIYVYVYVCVYRHRQ